MKSKPASIEIFKPGRHVAMSGAAFDFSESDLAATVAAYDPAKHEAPLVVGHPKSDDPAYGWTRSIALAEGKLVATPRDVDPAFAELVNSRRFSKISASFYPPDSPANPVQGVYYLRHVGFLGAQPPAVKGLKTPSFADADNDFITLEFSEIETTREESTAMTPEEIAAKQAELDRREAEIKAKADANAQKDAEFAERENRIKAAEAKAKTDEINQFVDGLVKAGKVLPKDQSNLVAFMSAENPGDAIDFAEDGQVVKKTGAEWLRGFLSGLQKQVEFGEIDKPGTQTAATADDQAIARRAREYKVRMDKAGENISFAEAVDAVRANKDGAQA
ncbi:hypothetical protein [Methylomicrobium sp. Wu6]|uniref:hypothetical protein n=1 Tax=Methylomicrobium sp. Wu6 TaxID=3107928 RepID=UPI002DD64644|nr:hypothetical protein [Methylomicrobium sp. Wu6]MEC4750043.1 hypothetical protein [Methylomicrobium sp. Wu6]